MKKQNLLLIVILTAFFACKNDQKSSDTQSESKDMEAVKESFKDDEIENALYTGYFVKTESGFDAVIKDNMLYLLKSNPTESDKSNHFFLHILPKNGKEINMDFAPSEFRYNDQLSDKFADVLVYKRELHDANETSDLNFGQFNEKGRTWNAYVQLDKLSKLDNAYHNEYLENTKNNRFLRHFEQALNEGYYMKDSNNYDLLLNGHTLYYIKANGNASDMEKMMFLHIKFNNEQTDLGLDFKPTEYQINAMLGKKYDNLIVLKREIPDNGKITQLGTGQYDKTGQKWSVVYEVEKLYDNMNFIYDDQYNDILND